MDSQDIDRKTNDQPVVGGVKQFLKKNIWEIVQGNSSSMIDEDKFYDAEENFPIIDDKYVVEIQVMDSEDITPLRNLKQKQKETIEEKYSIQLKQFYCSICMEAKPIKEMFKNPNCSHSFCEDCIGKYLAAKIQENISRVNCPEPNCKGTLEAYYCSSIIPKDAFDRWDNALCENSVLESQKFYCPFKDCSAMLVNDAKEVVTTSECPHCHRLFCAQCRVSWHAGVSCRKFQSLKNNERGGKEDLLAMNLANRKKWKRCPKCNYYVEKVHGCTQITCRCGHQFCYGCGCTWTGGSHYKCKA
ncbi:E3 ubiquitin-protein ligase RSL1-like [Vicia villosa]|uniref:E3 ubiquitin-protein ligase RSL1-like n=1 Tax=Vicia villosa TaxID=3911 RepID=UPI00273BA41F|nr:E3 ubiquitin-protein ligase RSL1-like [Vicia villosa]